MEIGNQVFMQYRRNADGSFSPLEKKNVDFGGGLERIAAAAIDSPDVFKISLIWPIIEKLQLISDKNYESHTESMRVIADHLRAATFLAVDGIIPSNKEQGYVMRRLLRRAIRFAFDLGIEQSFMQEVVPVIADLYHIDYPELAQKREEVIAILVKEEKIFRQTLSKGLRELGKFKDDGLTGAEIFTLYDTYGFPVELSTEEAFKQNISLSENWRIEFDAKMAEQRLRSQTATKGVFKGGLEGQTDIHKKYHTTAHLMAQALRMVLGDSVSQCGANINEERIRFDFKYPEKVNPEQIKQIEDIVNQQIDNDLTVSFAEYPLDEARAIGAVGEFNDKYGDKVKVYKIAADNEKPFSLEICGGPHINHTGELSEGGKKFKIIKEESSSAGVRRIKAILV
jgi:alanyl-tRNA synthetase